MTVSILTFNADDIPGIGGGVGGDSLFDSLIWQESRGRQTDAKGAPITSTKGAIGIAQVMPNTAPEAAALAGLPFDDVKYRTDPVYNKALGRAYFDKQLADFGDPAKALGAYNAGPAAMRRALATAEKAGNPDAWMQYLPAETQAYIPSILKKAGMTPGATAAAGPDYYKPSTTRYATLPPPVPERSTPQAFADAGLALASGVVAGAGLIANVAGADNPVARTLDDTAKSIDAMSSPARKAQVAARGETIRQAEATGDTWEEIKAYGGAFAEAPIETILNAVGTSAPTLLMGLIPGLAQAQAVRLIAQGAVGAAQGAGSVKGAIYDAVTQKLIDGGMKPDDAKKVAAGAQAYDGVNGGNIAVGAILGIAAGTTGAEAVIARIASGGVARAGGKGISKRVAIGVGKESPVEFTQDAQERGASNVALQNEGFDVPTMQGVIGQGTLAALASAPMGAVAGALDKNVPPALAPVADAADKPDSPLSRAAVAGNTGPAADAARNAAAADAAATNIDPATRLAELEAISKGTPDITNADGVTIAGDPGRFFTAEEQAEYKDLKARQATSTEASGADPLSEKAARISDAIREKGALDALRSEDAPVDAQEVLKDLAIAQSKSTPAARREQAMNRLEFALAWAGIHPADKVAPLGAKLDANGVPTGSPADINLADRRAAIDAATAPRAPAPQPEGQTYDGTQAAERAAAADKELQQDNLKAAAKPAPLPPADAVMAALKVIPALRTAEQTALVKQAEARYSLADMRVLEMGANYQAGMSATDKIQLERLRGVDSPGIVGPDKPSVSQKATDDAQKATIESDPAPQNEQIATPAVATPSGAGPAVLRKRRAVLAQVVELGLNRVERRGEEYFLTNGKKDFKLEGAADAQLARKAIQDAIRTGAEQANTEQTAAQALAGNYKKGRVEFDGLKLGIETPVGKSRTDKANDPPKWSTKMELAHYGDVTGTTGADGDGVDVYLVDNPRAGSPVFVIDQYKGDAFDETKSILGVATEAEALRIYDAGFSDGSGPSRRRAVTKMTVEEFKKWAFSDAAKKPAGSENGKTGSAADGAGDQGAGKQLPDIAGGVAAGGDGKVRPARANGNAAAGKPDAGGAKSAPAGDGGRGSNVTIQVDGKPVTVQTVGADELGAESSTREGRPSRKITKQNAELLQRLVAMFGKEVVFFKDPFGEIGDGFVEPGRDRTIFLNESSGISPLEVFGHELLHQIEISHPEIYAAIKKVVVAHLGENAPHQFRNDYHGRKAGPNSNAPLDNNDINELVSDLGGSMLSDAKFWREVFAQIETDNPGKSKGLIARLADLFYAMVDRLVAGIKQTGYRAGKLDVDANSNDFINDMKAVRAAFRDGLSKYIADVGITRTSMQAEILRAGVKQSKDRETTKNEISAIKKAREVLDDLRGEINPERGYADELEDDVQKAIDTIDSGGATPTMIREILDNLRGEINPERGYADELERDIIQAITTIDALDVAGSTAKRSTARESVTNTPEFKKWFGDSKVVDAEGKPLVVYHGTGVNVGNRGDLISGDFDTFDPLMSGKSSKTGAPSGSFFFTNDPEVASSYTVQWRGDFSEKLKDGANVMPVYLSLRKPLKISAKGENWRTIAYKGEDRDVNEIVRMAQESGKYDGVIIKRVLDHGVGKTSGKPSTTYVAFTPEQIKSATGNRGTFDASSADITRSTAREPGLDLTGYHFSKTPRQELHSEAHGMGLQDGNREDFQKSADERLRHRVYFYVDKGTGITPLPGLGGHAHRAKLNNVYDLNKDPLKLRKGVSLEAFESAVLDAGYDGYLDRRDGTQPGVVVMLGKRTIKPEYLGPRANIQDGDKIPGAAAPAAAKEYIKKGLMSKELAQLDVSRIPGARVKAGTLTVPLDSVQEANEEMARINSDIRFSKTRETDEDFEESSIVDSDGNLVTLYHGTAGIGDQAIEEFRLGHGLYGAGIYLTEYPNRAEAYAIGDRGHVYPVKASITNPYDADDFLDRYGKGTKTKARANEIREELIAEGYDGIVDRSMNKFWEVIAFHPEQIKFALDIPAKDIQRSRNREGLKPEIVETAGQVLRYLTPAERVKLRRDTAQTLVDIFKQLPSGNEMAAVAFAGRAKRGWYHNSARAIEHVFGHDAPRFAALLAAMSPQTSVEVNLRNALNTWKNWIAAGRPTSRGAIFEIMGRSVEGNRLTDSVLPAWVPNSVRALTAEDPTQIILSGPKVNSFMLNLRGVVEEVTNDAWMANYAAVDQRIFSGSLNAAGTDPGKGPGYMAMSAKVREAARKLTQLTGDEWTPAEVQETVWSWAKTLYELQSKDVGARELLDNKAVTDDLIASTPDFSSLLHEAKNEETLKRAGYGEQLGSLRSRADLAAARDQESTPSGQAGPFDPETQDRLERRAASRLEQLRDDRAAAEAVTRADNAQRSTARESVTETPEFKAWFKDSKVVDAAGKPLVVYHGTATPGFSEFDPKQARSEGGAFFFSHSSLMKNPATNANGYATRRGGAVDDGAVMPVYLRMTNPLIAGFTEPMPEGDEAIGQWLDRMQKFNRKLDANKNEYYQRTIKEAKRNGHDGVIFKNVEDERMDGGRRWNDETDVYAAFRPEQIKSATGNRGAFDPTDADITRSTAREDAFEPGHIEQLLDKDGWAIMTAENPAAKQSSAADNAAAMDALRADLRAAGARFQEVRGKYGNEENSLAITGIDEAQAIALGKKYGQESVLTRKGLVYQDGSITPATGITKYATAPDDFYSKIGDTIFSIGLDFDVRVTPQDVKLSKARDDQYEGHLNDGSSVQKHSAGGLYPYVVVARDAKDGKGYEYGLIGPDTDGYVWIGSWEETTDSAIDRKVARELRNSKRSPAREQEPSKIFGRELAPLAKKAYESLGGRARSAVDHWNVNWHTGALEQAFREDSDIAKEINAAFEPVRAKMREIYGDTIPMYRGEENEEVSRDDLQQRQLLSWTPLKDLGRQFAMSGYIEPKPITDEEINRVVKQYEESGYVKYRGKRYIVNRQNPDYYNIYDSARQPITDGDDLGASLRDDKAWIDDQTAERKAGGRLYFAGVPVDDAVWIPVNGNLSQPEVIAKYNPRTRAAEDVQLSPAREPIFYSQLELALEGVPDRLATMAAPQWKLWLDANAPKFGVKKEEIEWSGIKDYLSLRGKDKVTKDELVQYMRDSGVKVGETVLRAPAGDEFQVRPSPSRGGWEVRGADGNWWGGYASEDEARRAGHYNTPASPTKYDQYTVPGGENYREVLITLPSKKTIATRGQYNIFEDGELIAQGTMPISGARLAEVEAMGWRVEYATVIDQNDARRKGVYSSSHWDEPNVLAHIRVDDRVDADGKRTLFINEIQSDWGQQGKREGFNKAPMKGEVRVQDGYDPAKADSFEPDEPGKTWAVYWEDGTFSGGYPSREDAEQRLATAAQSKAGGVPSAPFVGKTESWVALALKRAIVMAAQNGYDKVAIITGDQAADNFDLSKSVERIGWDPQRIDGRTQKRVSIAMQTEADIEFYVNEKGVIDYVTSSEDHEYLSDKPLVDVVGKDIAERILQSSQGLIQDEGLKIGGEGMRAFYDKIVPQVANDVLKKIGGGKVGEVSMAKERFTGGVSGIDAMTGLGIPASQHRTYWAGLEAQERDDMIEAERERISAALTQPGFDITPEMREKLRNGAPLFSKAREQEETPEFKAWFGDSKVTENGKADGKPLVVYHGTSADITVFDEAKSRYGFWFSADSADAEDYGGNTVEAYLSLKNPAYFERISGDKGVNDAIAKAKSDGHDGLIVTAPEDGDTNGMYWPTNYVAFRPEQIKSATGNNGDFDPRNADITRSKYRDLDLANGYKVADLLDSSKTVSWWDETVGTPYHLAEKHPQFKRVYDAVQRFISDVSKYATRAADLAPNILPKLENLKDVFKSPLSAADVAALADPIFKGTLSYARDDQGKPVLTSDVGAAGVVWKDDELKSMWKLDDRQIGLYREFRRATNKSISDMATTHMVRYVGKDGDAVRDQVLAAPTVKAAYQILADHLAQLALATPGRADSLQNTVKTLKDTANMAQGLIAKGYAPLSRFGDYTVYVTRDGGKEQVFFGMYETEREANRAAREFKNDPKFADATIATGTMSKEASKLFKGITPETLALFGEALGLEESASDQESQVFQEYLKLAKANRSAMKHMIERKGIAGYSEDAGRVLASFVYSNARQSSTNLNAGEMIKSASEVQQGDLKDQAIKLVDYVQNPQEEAQTIRGMLFAQYIGGSIASALVNTTQSITTTWPTLSMYFGVGKAGKAMASALPIVKNGAGNDTELAAAMKRAEEEGVTAPQETHQLMAQAAGRGQLRSGDGTLIGDTLAKAKNSLAKVQMVWGKGFGFAELLNRQIAFVSAFNLAREKGMEDPYSFAKKIVAETQYVMNKGNNPSWARGPVGATLFTFRKFMINYLEGLARMWGGGPEGKKAFALSLAIMFMMAGVGGFPFADDLDDIIDGFAQRVLNKSFSSKLEKKQFFAKILGDAGADFVLSGISGLPGAPIDVSGRLGLGNIIPGTGLLVKKQDHSRDVKEITGAAGDFVGRMLQTGASAAQGDVRNAALNVLPVALTNAFKAKQMAELGYYQDFKGRKVIDTTTSEAILKGIGFQPSSVKKVQEATGVQQGLIALNKIRETEIADLWARGRIERKPELVEDARSQLQAWNKANPQSPITIDAGQISKRVQQANMTKAQRIAATAPKEIRKDVKAALDSDLAKQ